MMKKYSYIQEWGSYGNQTYVTGGMEHNEIVKDMLKKKLHKKAVIAYDKRLRGTSHYEGNAFVYNEHGRTILWFPDWKADDDHLETLVHETNHMIQNVLVQDKGMGDEIEAQAYQQEFLFREIRNTLNKAFKRKHLTNKKKHDIVIKDAKTARP